MKRFQVAGVAVATLAVLLTAGIAVTSSGGDDSDRIEVSAVSTTAATPSTTADSVTTTAALPLVDLHVQRWNDVVASDPNLVASTDGVGTVRYRYVGPNGGTSTFAQEPSIVASADVSFADVSGDGVDEALLPVAGSHGPLALLVYYATSTGPRLAEADESFWSVGGSKLGGRTESYEVRDGHIVRMAGVYSEHDLGCCPSGRVTTTYVLVGHRLVEAAPPSVVGSEQGWASASNRFVTSVVGGRYDDAYALFAPTVQAEIPADQWRQRFAATRTAFVQLDNGKDGQAAVVLTTVDKQGAALVVRQQRGDIRFGYHADARRWLIDELALRDTPYVAPAPKSAFVQGAFDVVNIDENAKTALVLLTCTAPVDKTIATPLLITVALADAHLQLNATDPPATFAEWVAAARTQLHWHIGISTSNPPPAPPRTYVSILPTSNLDTCP